MHFTAYCKSFQGVEALEVNKFLTDILSLQSTTPRPVFVDKRRTDRFAKMRFSDSISEEVLTELIENRILFNNEVIKVERVLDGGGRKRQMKGEGTGRDKDSKLRMTPDVPTRTAESSIQSITLLKIYSRG